MSSLHNIQVYVLALGRQSNVIKSSTLLRSASSVSSYFESIIVRFGSRREKILGEFQVKILKIIFLLY